MLSAGIILELRVSEILMSVMPIDTTPGETKGCALTEVLGQRVTAVAIDDVASPIVVLEGGLFLKDANDGCYGNPLLAGSLEAEYDSAQRREFLDFWTGKPLHLESSAIDSPATGPAT
jgi:hypothetical protein